MLYFDHAATTPVAPTVLDAMWPYFAERFGNPSSLHHLGVDASAAVQRVRRILAEHTASRPDDWIFTSGGTEANALALRGTLGGRRRRLVLSAIEHPSVAEQGRYLAGRGIELEVLQVDGDGRIDLEAVERLESAPDLISVMLANNVSGTIQPIDELVALVRERWPRCLIHCDAVQALAKIPLSIDALGVDLLSLSAHKICGPKGVGALYRRPGLQLNPLAIGGGQQGNQRSGTENVPGIVGFGAALELEWPVEATRRRRDRLWEGLASAIDGIRRIGAPQHTLPGHLLVDFGPLPAQTLLHHLEEAGILASSGSACSSNKNQRDPVLGALGIATNHAVIRFSLGGENDDASIGAAIELIPPQVERIRALGL
ncbi:MAG: cysteine desulfurase [Myxococcales bacterium]|nr:cysteine desulfurase [Myxococcales bacterium]